MREREKERERERERERENKQFFFGGGGREREGEDKGESGIHTSWDSFLSFSIFLSCSLCFSTAVLCRAELLPVPNISASKSYSFSFCGFFTEISAFSSSTCIIAKFAHFKMDFTTLLMFLFSGLNLITLKLFLLYWTWTNKKVNYKLHMWVKAGIKKYTFMTLIFCRLCIH